MSILPQHKTEISEHPSKNSVTRAVDPATRDADVERASRMFGIVQAFREGRYPDNKQIDDTLKYTLANSPIETEKLSSDGRKLVQDVREIIETARQVVLEKNKNEEFQNFLYATRKSDIAGNINLSAPVGKDEAQKHGESAGEAFRTLVTLFLRNGELRKIFQDLGYVGRDIFADGAAKAAEVSRPQEDKLNQVDQPAPDNEFHDEIPGALQKRKAEAKAEEVKQQARTDGADHAQDVANTVDPNASRDENKARHADKANEKASIISKKIPQKHKDNIKEQADRTQDYLKEKFPKERRDQFIYRLKKVVVECQKHRDYEESIDFFLNFASSYKGHAKSVHEQAAQSASQVRGENNVATAESSFRTLIESFANGRPTQPILDTVDQLYIDAANDSELRGWYHSLNSYIRRALQEPGFIMKDEADSQAKQLRESGKKFFVAADGRSEGKYVGHKDRLFKEIDVFFKAMGEDELNVKLGEDIKRLVHDLFLDAEGNPAFKPHLWSDISKTIGPTLLAHVGSVPLPRMEYSDPKVDLVIENLAIDVLNVIPSMVEADIRNHVKISHLSKLGDFHQHSFKITLHQIQTDLKGVHFAFEKKRRFPKLKESGTADIFVGGKGLTVTIHIDAESASKRHMFKVKQVKATIDKLDFALKGTSHDQLAKLVRPLATSLIKKSICKAAESGIRDALEDLDRQMVELRDRAERNKQIEGNSFTDAVKETFRKEKSGSDKESQGTFKFVTSKRESMMPNVGHPDSWVAKVDERSQLAKANPKNKEWYSPAFSIVAEGQRDPKNTESSRTSGLGSRSAAAAGAAGVGVGAGAAGLAAAAAHGAGQPGQTSTVYSSIPALAAAPTGNAPGAIVSPTGTVAGGAAPSNLAGTTAPLTAGTGATAVHGGASTGVGAPHNGNSIYYQEEPAAATKAAPAITNALPTTTTGAAPNTTSTL